MSLIQPTHKNQTKSRHIFMETPESNRYNVKTLTDFFFFFSSVSEPSKASFAWSHSIRRLSDDQMKQGLLERRSCAMRTLKLCQDYISLNSICPFSVVPRWWILSCKASSLPFTRPTTVNSESSTVSSTNDGARTPPSPSILSTACSYSFQILRSNYFSRKLYTLVTTRFPRGDEELCWF